MVSPNLKSNTGHSGHSHCHRLNVAELKYQLKDAIWEKTLGDKGKINLIFRNFQDSLVRNGITFQSFTHGLQTCGFRAVTQEEEWALFNTLDKDGSGIVNLKDFIKTFQSRKKPKSKVHSTDLFKKELNKFINKSAERRINRLMNQNAKSSPYKVLVQKGERMDHYEVYLLVHLSNRRLAHS